VSVSFFTSLSMNSCNRRLATAEMATDIKDRFPAKTVTLIHSRTKLMNNFHSDLHEIVLSRCTELGINVILGDRVKLPQTGYPKNASSAFDVELTSGAKVSTNLAVCFSQDRSLNICLQQAHTESCASQIVCTGQTPLSDPLKNLSPSSIDLQKGFVLVKPTLQISDPRYPNIFALGDVAMTGGPKAARPGLSQSQIVAKNIVKLASGGNLDDKVDTYTPDVADIHLSLGLVSLRSAYSMRALT
jgi:apoptosis-inducing factor 2